MNRSNYSETAKYRCLRELYPRQTEEIYLILCGIEQCTADKERVCRARTGYHLHVVMAGEGCLEAGGEKHMLGAGQMFLVKPGEMIAYQPKPDDPWSYCWISIDGTRAEAYMQEIGFTEGVYCMRTLTDTGSFYKICDRILLKTELNMHSALTRLGLALEFIGLAVESSGNNIAYNAKGRYKPIYRQSDYVQHAVEYIKNNYSSIAVTDVANYLGIDRSYFSAIFRQSMGLTPNEYLTQIRMQQSSRMLQSKLLPVKKIAQYVGYHDALTFSKAFKRFFGVSPRAYREMPDEIRPDPQSRNRGNPPVPE